MKIWRIKSQNIEELVVADTMELAVMKYKAYAQKKIEILVKGPNGEDLRKFFDAEPFSVVLLGDTIAD
jgi:hypothetical protein